jgi:CopG family transcriptional regulator, nickel-responsive regulator
MGLERFAVAIETRLLKRFDRLNTQQGLGNRSEAVRDLIRKRLVEEEVSRGREDSVATLTLIYDHGQRELSEKVTAAGHEQHAHVLSTLHVHLDHRLCLEVMALRGKPGELRQFAARLIGMKGVKHGQLVLSSARLWKESNR